MVINVTHGGLDKIDYIAQIYLNASYLIKSFQLHLQWANVLIQPIQQKVFHKTIKY